MKIKLLPVIVLLAVGLAVGGVISLHWSPPVDRAERIAGSGESTPAVPSSPLASIPAPLEDKKDVLSAPPDSARDAAPMPSHEDPLLAPITGESNPAKIVADHPRPIELRAGTPKMDEALTPPSAGTAAVPSSVAPPKDFVPAATPSSAEPPVPPPFPPTETLERLKSGQQTQEPNVAPLPPSINSGPMDLPPTNPGPRIDTPEIGVPPAPSAPIAKPADQNPKTPACPWSFQVTVVKGRAYLEARIGDDLQFTVSCENLQLKTPSGSVQAEGDVKVKGTNIEGTCKKLTLSWSDERVQLEGGVKLKCKQDGQDVDLTGEQLSIKLAVVDTLPMPAPAE